MIDEGSLFRPEAFAARADRLAGDITIAVPVSWQVIGYLVFGMVATGLLFLCLGTYSRVQVVPGEIVPNTGVLAITAGRDGVVVKLNVRDGDYVKANAELGVIRSEEFSTTGGSAGAQVEHAINEESGSISAQLAAIDAGAKAQQDQVAQQRIGLKGEINQLETQLLLQQGLIASAERDLNDVRGVAERGFISKRDLQAREDLVITRRQNSAQLEQALDSKRSSLLEADRSAAQLMAQARAQHANLAASRAHLSQEAATTSGARSYVLRAPVAGQVTAITIREGQPAAQQTPLMVIVPSGSTLRAELAIPSTAIGFVKEGQEVRVAIDAFPYQRFGTITGKVSAVARSVVRQQAANGQSVLVYPTTVALKRSTIDAYGRQEPLMPGMTLTARVVTERQTLLQWLSDPLLAVRRR